MKTRIKELRIAKRLTQLQLAMSVGCSQNTISRIELDIAAPNADLLIELSNFFDVSIDYLLYRSDLKGSCSVSSLTISPRVAEYARKLQLLASGSKETVYSIIDRFISLEHRRD